MELRIKNHVKSLIFYGNRWIKMGVLDDMLFRPLAFMLAVSPAKTFYPPELMKPDQGRPLKAEPFGCRFAPALTGRPRPGKWLSKQAKDAWGRVCAPNSKRKGGKRAMTEKTANHASRRIVCTGPFPAPGCRMNGDPPA